MADVPMAQVLLDRTGVVPFVGQLESARVPQHMRVNRERKAGGFADACDKPWHWLLGLLGRPASESGRGRQATEGHRRGERRGEGGNFCYTPLHAGGPGRI